MPVAQVLCRFGQDHGVFVTSITGQLGALMWTASGAAMWDFSGTHYGWSGRFV
jgi:hypothetical protein